MAQNWDQIAAIASVFGVVGGLLSLIFLIVGVRRNARALEGSTVQALMIFEKDVYTLLLAHADVFMRGCADCSALSAEDRFRFDRLVNAQMSLFYSAYVQHQQNLMEHEVWQAYAHAMAEDLAAPGFRASWHAMQANYPQSFARLTESPR